MPRIQNKRESLPRPGDPPLVIEAHGSTAVVTPSEGRGEWIVKFDQRARIGSRRDTLEDIEYFQIYGTLPPSTGGIWTNPGPRRRNGWVGRVCAVENYLGVAGADKDPDGRFLIGGEPPVYGYGGDEIVLSDAVVYYLEGRPVPLAAAMADTSSGTGIRVFNED